MRPGKHHCAKCRASTDWKKAWVKRDGEALSRPVCKCVECGRKVRFG